MAAYLAGQHPTIQAQVVHVVSSEGFNAQSLFVTKEVTSEPEVEEQEVEVVEEPVVVHEPAQEVVHHVHVEAHHHHHHHHHEVKEHVVEAVHHVEHKEVAHEHVATEHVQGETTTVEGEAPKEHNGEKKFNKKPYQKRTNSGGQRKPREPREPRGEGENTQQTGENGEHKRGQRQHHNGPRHGGNRSGNKRHEGEQNENNENANTNVVNDGWNVVTKGPQKPEYKPRREGGAHHHNKERPQGQGEQGQKRGDGQKRPNHSGNKRPFNKDRPQGEQGQNQYVRKEKTATEAPEQPAQNWMIYWLSL